MRRSAISGNLSVSSAALIDADAGCSLRSGILKFAIGYPPAAPLRAVCREMKFDLRGASNTHRLTLTERARDQNFINCSKIRDVYNCR